MYNLDIGRMPPLFLEEVEGHVPAGGSVTFHGSTVPADENWLLTAVSVYVPNSAPCYAVLQMEPIVGVDKAWVDLAMTKERSGSDLDLLDCYVTKRVIIPGGGRLVAFVKNGSGQAAGSAWLEAHYLRFPRGAMPQGF